MLQPGDRVRHSAWHDPKRVGHVARVFKQVFEMNPAANRMFAEVEWPRPEGNLSHDVTFLTKVE